MAILGASTLGSGGFLKGSLTAVRKITNAVARNVPRFGAAEKTLDAALHSAQRAVNSAERLGIAASDLKRVTNSANHIFGPKKIVEHKLGGFLEKFAGDQIHAFKSLEDAAQALANEGRIEGIFETTVLAKDTIITVKGRVIDGLVKIGTAYIP
jgi:hypothetical protein